PAALLERLAEELLHSVDGLEHLRDLALRILAARRADRHGHRADLALLARELALRADAEHAALAEHEQPIARLADLGQDVTRDQHGVLLLQIVDQLAHLDDL